MPRIAAPTQDQAPAGSQPALEGVQKAFGFIPNSIKTMANAPAALNGYLALGQALSKSSLSAAEREVVALATSEVNGCNYCIAAHAALGKKVGLSKDDMLQALTGELNALALLARQITESRGHLTDAQIAAARDADLTDAKIVEVVAQVAQLTLTNYINNIAASDLDFPPFAR
ncbi:carboxymuconolactone decarboxylase family protein [Pseudomonas sp.]|uniref:carboxymuconolactone decarboxylase family protein n=1 Tax=Pseudomonas sp. TaxID=306 RepID=UPI003A97FC85